MTENHVSWSNRIKDNMKDLTQARSKLKSHHQETIVIGLGRFGTGVAMTLTAFDHNILAIDADPKRVQEISHLLPHVIQLDATNIEALREVEADTFDTGIVCIGTDFEANLLATVNLRKLGIKRVITKARTITQQEILLQVGANEVILPEHEAGVRLAQKLAGIGFLDFMEISPNMGVIEIITPEHLVGKSLLEAAVRQRYGLVIIAIKRGENEVIVSPQAEEVMQKDDILVVLGRTEDCKKLQ